MEAIVLTGQGAPKDVIEYTTLPIPEPGPGQVQINVRALSINSYEWRYRAGQLAAWFPNPTFPAPIGCDVSGFVTQLGEGVDKFSLGDEVYSYCGDGVTKGCSSQYCVVDAAKISLKPTNISHSQAATVTCVGLTAYQGIFEHAKLRRGSSVVIVGGAGGVGSYCTQICSRILGCKKVIAIASDRNKDLLLTEFGATHFVNYKEDVDRQIGDILASEDEEEGETQTQVDYLIDCFGNGSCEKYSKYVKDQPDCGILSFADFGFKPNENWKRKFNLPQMHPSGSQLEIIRKYIEDGKLKAIVSKELEWEEYAEAHVLGDSGQIQGKVAIKVKPINDVKLHIIAGEYFGQPNAVAIYVLERNDEFMLIDCSVTPTIAKSIRPFMEEHPGKKLKYIFLTHYHMDHTGGIAALLAEPYAADATVLCSSNCASHIKDPSRNIAETKMYFGSEGFDQFCAPCDPIPPAAYPQLHILKHDELVDGVYRFYHTPGHTSGHFCLFHEGSQSLFVGDSLGVFFAGYAVACWPPSEFEPKKVKKSFEFVESVLAKKVENVYETHFGRVELEIPEDASVLGTIVSKLSPFVEPFEKKIDEVGQEIAGGGDPKEITGRLVMELLDLQIGPAPEGVTPGGEDDPRMAFKTTMYLNASGVVATAVQNLKKTETTVMLRELGQDPLCDVARTEPPNLLPGGVLVKPLYSYILNFAVPIFAGKTPFRPPVPFVPGCGAVAVVEEVAEDVVGLSKGQVVFCTPWMKSQINDPMTPPDGLIQGWFFTGPTTKTLDPWKNGMWTTTALARATNVYPIHPDLLKTPEAYKDCAMINWYCIAHQAVRKAGCDTFGKTVLVNGASGQLGQCAVHLCLAYGAREVYCVSRSKDTLGAVFADFADDPRVKFVTQDELPVMACEAVIDFLGIVPTGEPTSKSIGCLKPEGTIVFCGGVYGEVTLNYGQILGLRLNVCGSLMYEPDEPQIVMGLMMSGALKLPKRTYHDYFLDQINQALFEAFGDHKRICLMKMNDVPE